MSTPSMQHGAPVGIVGADHQVHQRGLARAGGPDHGEGAAGLDPEGDVLEHPAPFTGARIAEPDVANSTARAPCGGGRSTGIGGPVMAGCSRKSWLIRPIDAAPRWTRLTAQPSAIIGHTSIAEIHAEGDELRRPSRVPAITSRPPAYSTASALRPPSRERRGKKAPAPGPGSDSFRGTPRSARGTARSPPRSCR